MWFGMYEVWERRGGMLCYLPSKSHTPTREQIIVRGLCREHAEFLFCDEGRQVGDFLGEGEVVI